MLSIFTMFFIHFIATFFLRSFASEPKNVHPVFKFRKEPETNLQPLRHARFNGRPIRE